MEDAPIEWRCMAIMPFAARRDRLRGIMLWPTHYANSWIWGVLPMQENPFYIRTAPDILIDDARICSIPICIDVFIADVLGEMNLYTPQSSNSAGRRRIKQKYRKYAQMVRDLGYSYVPLGVEIFGGLILQPDDTGILQQPPSLSHKLLAYIVNTISVTTGIDFSHIYATLKTALLSTVVGFCSASILKRIPNRRRPANSLRDFIEPDHWSHSFHHDHIHNGSRSDYLRDVTDHLIHKLIF